VTPSDASRMEDRRAFGVSSSASTAVAGDASIPPPELGQSPTSGFYAAEMVGAKVIRHRKGKARSE